MGAIVSEELVTDNEESVHSPFLDGRKMAALMTVSKSFLRELRESEEWQEGVHWVYLNPRVPNCGIRYNSRLCLHWLQTRHDPKLHDLVVQLYIESLSQLYR